MKTLIVDDDFTTRLVLQKLLEGFGPTHVAINGNEAVQAVAAAMKEENPYDLVCMDIMMPEMDGQEALKQIRNIEDLAGYPYGSGSKVVMTTSLSDRATVMTSFREDCDGYLVKPIDKTSLLELLRKQRLID